MSVEQLVKNEAIKITPEFSVAFGAWGKPVTNDDLLKIYTEGKTGQALSNDSDFLTKTGFVTRHHSLSPFTFLETRESISREMVSIGTQLTQQTMEMNGWKNADHLIITTSTPADEEGNWGREIAKQSGIPPENVSFSFMACNGAIAALLDTLKRAELTDSKVVITAVEPLGYMVNPGNFKESSIFGNGAASLAFRPQRLTLVNGITVIKPDTFGVIRSPKTYHLPTESERLLVPSWYEYPEDSQDVFACSNSGVFLVLPESLNGYDADSDSNLDGRYLQMNPTATAKYFARIVPQVQLGLFRDYYQNIDPKFSQIILSVISHQPSKGVLSLAGGALNKALIRESLPEVNAPWVMDQIGMGNVSSATTLISLAELVPTLAKDEIFNLTAYGIGSGVTSMNIKINR